MTAAHSIRGASSMHRWAACPGSIREIEAAKIPSTSSVYAEEGTDAHALGAAVLRGEARLIESLVGETVAFEGRTFEITQEMFDAIVEYEQAIRADVADGAVLHVEHRFDLSEVYPGCFGTADAVVWQPKTKTLIVSDLKYGAGLPVKVQDNPQLLYYGLGALLNLKYPARKVVLRVVQPRCAHPDGSVRETTLDAIDLIDFAGDLARLAKDTEKPDAPLVAGDHCRFCPAIVVCPEVQRKRQEMAALEFGEVSLPDRPAIDPEKLALALESLPVLEAFIKRVREVAYSEAERGRCPPRHKIVAKQSRRQWRNEADVIEHLEELGRATPDIYTEPELKSPAQLEKIVGKGTLDAFITTTISGHALVPESDKRPAIRSDAAVEFTSVDLIPEVQK